jgi:hypothetical protein
MAVSRWLCRGVGPGLVGVLMVYLIASCVSAGAEGDDAPDRVVRGNSNGHSIARHHFYAEAAHSAAQLGEYLVTGVTLNPVEAAAMDCHDRSLHINQVVLAQIAVGLLNQTLCHIFECLTKASFTIV